ncbi:MULTISPECIES: hypothetical protein [Nocardia]|uniref:hypothetical protein n=1 Tax=Nocardia TaxID=1817 RepID=UPI002458445F|nr:MULTISPECIES: hypothetical protein [Nocardia]
MPAPLSLITTHRPLPPLMHDATAHQTQLYDCSACEAIGAALDAAAQRAEAAGPDPADIIAAEIAWRWNNARARLAHVLAVDTGLRMDGDEPPF